MKYFTPEEERNLIQRAHSGCESSRQTLVAGALPFVRKKIKCCFPALPDSDLDDISQELFIKLLKVVDKYDLSRPAHTRFYNFAHKTIYTTATDWLSGTRRELSLENLSLPEGATEEACPVEQRERQAQARSALNAVSGREHDVLLARFFTDDVVRLREIADQWNCTEQNVYYIQRKALSVAKTALRAQYSIVE